MEQYTKTPLHLQNFTVTKTYSEKQRGIRTFFVCGHLEEEKHKKLCPCCGYQAFHSNGKRTIKLKHMSVADFQIVVEIEYTRWECQICHACFRTHIPFKEKGHRITKLFMRQLLDKLENGNTVLRTAKELHSNRNLVKKIDKQRLQKIAGDMKPTHFSPFISVDEFSLHKNHQYATVVIDYCTGESLFVTEGNGMLTGIKMRQEDGKRKAIEGFRNMGFRTFAAGDSYNDLNMIKKADKGCLFRAPENILKEEPNLKLCTSYSEFYKEIESFVLEEV